MWATVAAGWSRKSWIGNKELTDDEDLSSINASDNAGYLGSGQSQLPNDPSSDGYVNSGVHNTSDGYSDLDGKTIRISPTTSSSTTTTDPANADGYIKVLKVDLMVAPIADHDNVIDNDVLIVDSGDDTTTRTTTSMSIRITTHTTLININSTTTNGNEQTEPHTELLQSNNGNIFLIHFITFFNRV